MDAILSFEKEKEDDFYELLGCDELSGTDQIQTEYKLKALGCHPDKHRDDPRAAERFAKLQKAKETLCNAESRDDYDRWRRSGLCISYSEWCARKDTLHTSMHWACLPKKERMLENKKIHVRPKLQQQASVNSSDEEHLATHSPAGFSEEAWARLGWQREDNEMLRKFRNYEI